MSEMTNENKAIKSNWGVFDAKVQLFFETFNSGNEV